MGREVEITHDLSIAMGIVRVLVGLAVSGLINWLGQDRPGHGPATGGR